MRERICFFVVLFFVGSAYGENTKESHFEAQIGGISVHEHKKNGVVTKWNEKNTGIAFQYVMHGMFYGEQVDYFASLGQIKNSEFGQSRFVGSGIRTAVFENQFWKVYIGAFGGIMTYPGGQYLSKGDILTKATCFKVDGTGGGSCVYEKVQQPNVVKYYNKNGNKIFPTFAPSVSFCGENVCLDTTLLSKVSKNGSSAALLLLRFSL